MKRGLLVVAQSKKRDKRDYFLTVDTIICNQRQTFGLDFITIKKERKKKLHL